MRFRIVNAYTDPSPAGTALRMASIVVVVCLAMFAIAIVAMHVEASEAKGGQVAATEAPATEICFPAKLWGGPGSTASPEDRPCDIIERPAEDGSGSLTLGTIGADAAICSVPNPYEERGHFAVKCHRVRNR